MPPSTGSCSPAAGAPRARGRARRRTVVAGAVIAIGAVAGPAGSGGVGRGAGAALEVLVVGARGGAADDGRDAARVARRGLWVDGGVARCCVAGPCVARSCVARAGVAAVDRRVVSRVRRRRRVAPCVARGGRVPCVSALAAPSRPLSAPAEAVPATPHPPLGVLGCAAVGARAWSCCPPSRSACRGRARAPPRRDPASRRDGKGMCASSQASTPCPKFVSASRRSKRSPRRHAERRQQRCRHRSMPRTRHPTPIVASWRRGVVAFLSRSPHELWARRREPVARRSARGPARRAGEARRLAIG